MTMLRLGGFILISLGCMPLVACSSDNNYAPVIDISQSKESPVLSHYAKHAGLAITNRARPAAASQLREASIATISDLPLPSLSTTPMLTDTRNSGQTERGWMWPAAGRVVQSFSAINKGVNIGGYLGQPVYAAASGKVVYSGRGLPGYGNLVILEHSSLFLSAYAHNNKLLVHTGDIVKKGQIIAEMGKTDSNLVMLHFEIRRNGKPLNPSRFLKSAMMKE